MLPFEIIQFALEKAPGDADRVLAYYINTVPPVQRQTVYDRVARAIASGRLTGELRGRLQTPRLFTADMANQTWEELETALGTELANNIAHFFKPDGMHFAPQAYPGRWAPPAWNMPLTPKEVRDQLSLSINDLRNLEGIARALAGKEDAKIHRLGKGERGASALPLQIAVLPYADTLPMVTLLYAVSDLVGGLNFRPSTFYHESANPDENISIDKGLFGAGYATSYQIRKIKKVILRRFLTT
jgi:hypothetical protein